MPATLIADIAAAMKGKKSFSSMEEAVSGVVANAKITASQTADRTRANMSILADHPDHATLFADRVTLCATKAPEDLRNLVAARIGEHQKREAERLEAERARIRQEEAERLHREQAAAQPKEIVEAAEAAKPDAVPAAIVSTIVQQTPSAADRLGARIKLGDINARIAPLTISSDGLTQLGFAPVAKERSATLYREADFPSICQALSSVLVQATQKRAA